MVNTKADPDSTRNVLQLWHRHSTLENLTFGATHPNPAPWTGSLANQPDTMAWAVPRVGVNPHEQDL